MLGAYDGDNEGTPGMTHNNTFFGPSFSNIGFSFTSHRIPVRLSVTHVIKALAPASTTRTST